jgi:O-antigen ligase
MISAHLGAAIAVVAAATVVAASRRWSTAAPIALTILALVLSNGSVSQLKDVFLNARWGALAAAAAAFAFELPRNPRDLVRLLPLAGLPGLGLLSAIWSVEPRLTIERGASFGLLLVVAVGAAARWRRDPAEMRRAVDALAAVSVIVLVGSLLLAAVSNRAFLGSAVRGLFENPNGLGLFLGLTYPFVASALRARGRQGLAFVVLGGYAVVAGAAQSRSGLLALVIVAVAASLARRPRLALTVGAVLAAAVVVLALVLPRVGNTSRPQAATPAGHAVLQTPAPSSIGARPTGHPSLLSRLTGARSETWPVAWRFIRARPVQGYGFGTGDRLFGLYPSRVHFVFFEGANPSNGYLQLAMELGIVGALLFFFPIFVAARYAVRALSREDGEGSRAAFAAVFCAALAVAFVESTLTSAGAPWALLLWLSAALWLAPSSISAADIVVERFTLSRLRFERPRLVAATLVTGLVAATLAVLLPHVLRNAPPPRPRLLAQHLAALTCSVEACRVAGVSRIQGTFFWVELKRSTESCYVVDSSSFNLKSVKLEGISRARCAGPPLVRPHVLTVAVLDSRPPYYIATATTPGGFEPAVVQELAHRLGVGLVAWVNTRGKQMPRRADLVVHVYFRGSRASLQRTLVPYFIPRSELVVRRGSPVLAVPTTATVRKLRLGVIDAQTARETREDLGHIRKILRFTSFGAAVSALRRHNVDGLVLDLGTAVGVSRGAADLTTAVAFPPHVFYAMKFRKGSRLRPIVAQKIDQMERDGTLQRFEALLGPIPKPVPELDRGSR